MSISCLGIPNKQRKGKRVSVNSKFFSHKKGHWNNRRWDRGGKGKSKNINRLPANIYFFKINNRNTRKRCEICSKLTIKAPEWRRWRRSGVFIVNFEHVSHLTSSVFLVDFKQVNLTWVEKLYQINVMSFHIIKLEHLKLESYYTNDS